MEPQPRMNVKVLGTLIGTASGWDAVDTTIFSFYDFEPVIPLLKEFKNTSISIDFDSGEFESYDLETGDPIGRVKFELKI